MGDQEPSSGKILRYKKSFVGKTHASSYKILASLDARPNISRSFAWVSASWEKEEVFTIQNYHRNMIIVT